MTGYARVWRLLQLMLGMTISGLAAACVNSPPVTPGVAISAPTPGYNQESYVDDGNSSYILRPADTIGLLVFREPDLSLPQVVIAADGQISVPLVGNVHAAGMTPDQLEAQVEQALGARYLRSPNVAVNVIAYGSHLVTVEGAVKTPGVFTFSPGTRLSGGIALAEGPTRVAARDQIAVFRQIGGEMQVAKFEYAALQAGTMADPLLQPGDRVVVGIDGLSQFWQDFLTTVPLFGLFTRF